MGICISELQRIVKMARLFIIAVLLAFLACFATGEEELVKNRSKRLIVTDLLLGKRCSSESECKDDECCTPFLIGHRCRRDLSEGDYCAKSYIGTHIDRIYRKCPCKTGLTCRTTKKILGLFKILNALFKIVDIYLAF